MKLSIWLSVIIIIFLIVVGVFKFSGKSQEQKINNLKDFQKQEDVSYTVDGNENEVFVLLEQNLADEEVVFNKEISEVVSEKTFFNKTLEDFNKIDYENIIQ